MSAKSPRYKSILPDPYALHAAGLRTLTDALVLVTIGRCGIVGARRQGMTELLRVPYATVRSSVERLCDLGLVCEASRDNGTGCAINFLVTRKGWELLTTPADLGMYPQQAAAV
jgi:hypothetical protein